MLTCTTQRSRALQLTLYAMPVHTYSCCSVVSPCERTHFAVLTLHQHVGASALTPPLLLLLLLLLLLHCLHALHSDYQTAAVTRVVKVARDGAVGSPRQHSEYSDTLRLLRVMCLGANCIMLTYTGLLLYGTFSEAGRGSPLLFYSVLHGAAPGVWISYNMQVSPVAAAALHQCVNGLAYWRQEPAVC
jgi:hypothetical protein